MINILHHKSKGSNILFTQTLTQPHTYCCYKKSCHLVFPCGHFSFKGFRLHKLDISTSITYSSGASEQGKESSRFVNIGTGFLLVFTFYQSSWRHTNRLVMHLSICNLNIDPPPPPPNFWSAIQPFSHECNILSAKLLNIFSLLIMYERSNFPPSVACQIPYSWGRGGDVEVTNCMFYSNDSDCPWGSFSVNCSVAPATLPSPGFFKSLESWFPSASWWKCCKENCRDHCNLLD